MSKEKLPMIKVENLQTHFPVFGGFFKRKVGSVKAVDNISIVVEREKHSALLVNPAAVKLLGQDFDGSD